MSFENKQKIGDIDLGWKAADYVSPTVSFENDDLDKDPSKLSFAWFKTESTMKPSKAEEEERIQAMKYQFEHKIINKYGMPYGREMPKELRDIIEEKQKEKKGSKFDRQRKRMVGRQIEKDMRQARAQELKDFNILGALKSDADLQNPFIGLLNNGTK